MSPLGMFYFYSSLFDILEWWGKLKQIYIVFYFDLSQRYILMKVSDSNQGKKKHKFHYACSLCAEGSGQKNDQQSFPFVSNTLQMALFCFPSAVQALKMGDKGSQRVKANS